MQRAAGLTLLCLGGFAAYVGIAMAADAAFRLAVLVLATLYLIAAALNLTASTAGVLVGRVMAGVGIVLGAAAIAVGIAGSGTPNWGDLIAATLIPIGVLLVSANLAVLVMLRGVRTSVA